MTHANRWTLALAAGATGTALCLSVLAGWQRGGSLAERLVWVAIGVVLVVSAHLLPALIRGSPALVRGVGRILWLTCMAAACFGHAQFFVLAQQHAGELRAAAVPKSAVVPTGPNLTAVMAERAEVTARLAAANAQPCPGHCPTLEARRVTLGAKLDALDAEADDLRRRQAADDRAVTRRDALMVDPVTARLAALLGTTVARVDLLSGLAFAMVLEGVSCLIWTVALQSRAPAMEILAVAAPAMASHVLEPAGHGPETVGHAPDSTPVTPLPAAESADPDVTQLAQAVAAGLVRPTVSGIRQFLGCSQAKAIALRRRLAALTPAA